MGSEAGPVTIRFLMEVRADLSLQLGLSDRQLQMWFCHRRLKDKKEKDKEKEKEKEKQPKKEKAIPAIPPAPAHSASLMPTSTKTNFYDDYDD